RRRRPAAGGPRRRLPRSSFSGPLILLVGPLALDPFLLGSPPLVFAKRDPLDLDGASDEDAGADEPGVLAVEAEQMDAPGPQEVGGLALVENVLLQLSPVVVAPADHLGHEAVEGGRHRLRRQRRGDTPTSAAKTRNTRSGCRIETRQAGAGEV